MASTFRNDKALREQGQGVTANQFKTKRITKLDRIVNLLKSRPEGLNRFEAATYGDTCLNSTISVIRDIYGDRLTQRWENVPTRHCVDGVRVKRYWLVGGGSL